MTIECKRCWAGGVYWKETSRGWRMYDEATNKPHECRKPQRAAPSQPQQATHATPGELPARCCAEWLAAREQEVNAAYAAYAVLSTT